MISATTSWLLVLAAITQAGPPALEAQLKAEEVESLARGARVQGDPARGAVVFHLPQLACVTCHASPGDVPPLGPDRARLGKDVADAHLIESLLEPSKVIERGYETISIATGGSCSATIVGPSWWRSPTSGRPGAWRSNTR